MRTAFLQAAASVAIERMPALPLDLRVVGKGLLPKSRGIAAIT